MGDRNIILNFTNNKCQTQYIGTFVLILVAKFFVMKSLKINLTILILFGTFSAFANDYVRGSLLVKVLPKYASICTESDIRSQKFNHSVQGTGFMRAKKLFPTNIRRGKVNVDLVYELFFSEDVDVIEIAEKLKFTGLFEYVEPRYISHPFFIPNDPNVSNQWHHALIKSFEAWDIEQGDTSVIIGITDSSFDTQHPDLVANIKRNWTDPVDGLDNDNDGYTDNFLGWDIADNDNNLYVSASYHGTGVAAFSSATVNNSVGVAGTGFACKFIPIKVAPNSNQNLISNGYDGIVYALQKGCKVINCSWGNTTYSRFAKDVIDLAVFNYDATVVASSGNSLDNQIYYPASYPNVLSVGGTKNNDEYHYTTNKYVDLVAPAFNVYGTASSSPGSPVYASSGGTSFSAPMVAGAVALVRSYFPQLNALQAAEQVKVHTDNIYSIPANASMTDMLGTGRLNMQAALQGSNPSVVMQGFSLDEIGDEIASIGTQALLKVDFVNLLSLVNNVSVTLSSSSPYVSVIQNTANLGNLLPLQTTNIDANPYVVSILPGTPLNQKIEFKLSYSGDGGYNAYEYFETEVNRDYVNLTVNNLKTTATTRGKIGYNTLYGQAGLGISYAPFNDSSTISLATFMVGLPDGRVSDIGYSNTPPAPEFDFSAVNNIMVASNSGSDYTTLADFNDNNAGSNAIGIQIKQKTLAWTDEQNDDFVLFVYYLTNNTAETLDSVYVGIFADWEVSGTENIATFNTSENLVIATNPLITGLHMGIRCLEDEHVSAYNLDVVSGGAGGVNIFDGFSGTEKFITLSQSRPTAGGSGGDVASIISYGPLYLTSGQTDSVAFAILGALNESELIETSLKAYQKYNSLVGIPTIGNQKERIIYPNPTDGLVNIDLGFAGIIELRDLTGRVLRTYNIGVGNQFIDISDFDKGMYLIVLEGSKNQLIIKK